MEEYVAPMADVDPVTGALPTDLHHIDGRVGGLRRDPKNLIGLARETHAKIHDREDGLVIKRKSLVDLW